MFLIYGYIYVKSLKYPHPLSLLLRHPWNNIERLSQTFSLDITFNHSSKMPLFRAPAAILNHVIIFRLTTSSSVDSKFLYN